MRYHFFVVRFLFDLFREQQIKSDYGQCFRLIFSLYEYQRIVFFQQGAAAGNDDPAVPLYHDDQAPIAEGDVPDSLIDPLVPLFENQLIQFDIIGLVQSRSAEDQDVISHKKGISVGYDPLSAADDEIEQAVRREEQLPDLLRDPGMIGRQLKFGELNIGCFAIVGEGFEDIGVFVDHIESQRNSRDQSSLKEDRNQDDAEDDMIDLGFAVGGIDDRHCRKYDGGGPAQSRPGYEKALVGGAVKRREDSEDGERSCDEGQKEHDDDSRAEDGGKFRGGRKKTEEKENQHLHQTGQAVEEMYKGLFRSQRRVADDDSYQVGGEIAVPAESGRQSIGDQCDCDHHDRVHALCPELETAEDQQGQGGNQNSENNGVGDLCEDEKDDASDMDFTLHDCQKNGGQHIGEGVVASAFDLKHRGGAVAKIEFLGAQDGKDGSGIRRADNRPEKQTFRKTHAEDEMAEKTGESRGQDHA